MQAFSFLQKQKTLPCGRAVLFCRGAAGRELLSPPSASLVRFRDPLQAKVKSNTMYCPFFLFLKMLAHASMACISQNKKKPLAQPFCFGLWSCGELNPGPDKKQKWFLHA